MKVKMTSLLMLIFTSNRTVGDRVAESIEALPLEPKVPGSNPPWGHPHLQTLSVMPVLI